MKKILISAVSKNNIIGKNKNLPWKNSEELNHFKNTTLGSAVLMGRVTYESLEKPLTDRLNLIISKTRKENKPKDNLYYFSTIKSAIEFSEKENSNSLFIAGGSEIYSQLINDVDELLISQMPFEIEGDKYFPAIDKSIWELDFNKEYNSFKVEKYIKKNNSEIENKKMIRKI